MSKKYELTDEHKAQIPGWRDKWIANALRCGEYTEEEKQQAREAVVDLYQAAGLKAPKTITFVKGPVTGAVASGISAGIWWLRGNTYLGQQWTEAEISQACAQAIDLLVESIHGPAPEEGSLSGDAATYGATDTATNAATDTAIARATYEATYGATDTATNAATYGATNAATYGATARAIHEATNAATNAATDAATNTATARATHEATYEATRVAIDAATARATARATDTATNAATDAATNAATNAATDTATYAAIARATRVATYAATRVATRVAIARATNTATRVAIDAATDEAINTATDAATRAATRAATYEATRVATNAAINTAINTATYAATDAATYEVIDEATDAATYEATDAAINTATARATDTATNAATYTAINTELELRDTHCLVYFLVSCIRGHYKLFQGGNHWSGWASFLSFFRHIAQLPVDYSKWACAEKLAEFGPRWASPDFCIISELPDHIYRDADSRPHAEQGPFCSWRDGVSLYYWHGVAVPKKWITDPDSLDPVTALNWANVEQRRAAAEILGWDKICDHLGAEVIDEDPDPTVGTLLVVDLPDAEGAKFLKVQCATGRTFVLPTAPEATTARQAQALMFGLDNDYQPPGIQA